MFSNIVKTVKEWYAGIVLYLADMTLKMSAKLMEAVVNIKKISNLDISNVIDGHIPEYIPEHLIKMKYLNEQMLKFGGVGMIWHAGQKNRKQMDDAAEANDIKNKYESVAKEVEEMMTKLYSGNVFNNVAPATIESFRNMLIQTILDEEYKKSSSKETDMKNVDDLLALASRPIKQDEAYVDQSWRDAFEEVQKDPDFKVVVNKPAPIKSKKVKAKSKPKSKTKKAAKSKSRKAK